VKPRKDGFASSTIFERRVHSFSRYAPVPTGCAMMSSPYFSTTSRAIAEYDVCAILNGKL